MTQFPVSTSNEQSIHAALELSKNSWLLAFQAPGRDNPSLYPIKGGDAKGLMAKLDAARVRVEPGRYTSHARLAQRGGALAADDATREANQDRRKSSAARTPLAARGGRHGSNPIR